MLENRNALTSVLTNPMVLILIVTLGGVVLAGKFWSDFRQTLRQDPQFALSPDRVRLTTQPSWIHSDFRQSALGDFDWQNRSLLDQSLVQDLGQHLEHQLWVRQVLKVSKDPAGLTAELEYRRPVGMVELGGKKLFPVDTDGVALDSGEFSPNQAEDYLRISIAGLADQAPKLGVVWPDARVAEASRIADWLSHSEVPLGVIGVYGISRRVSVVENGENRSVLETEYRLWTGRRNEIIWGHAVGLESAGEASAQQKLSALIEVTRRHGPIDGMKDLLLPEANVLDLRSGKLVQLQNKAAACVVPQRR